MHNSNWVNFVMYLMLLILSFNSSSLPSNWCRVWCFASNFGHSDPFIGASVYAVASAAGTIACSASDWIFLSYSHPKIRSSPYMAIKYGFSVLFKDFVRTTKLLFILYAFESFVFNLRFWIGTQYDSFCATLLGTCSALLLQFHWFACLQQFLE